MYYLFAPSGPVLNPTNEGDSNVRKLVLMATIATLTVSARAQQGFAAEEAGAQPTGAAPAVRAPATMRFILRGGETVDGTIVDRLPNGVIVRLADGTTRVIADEDVVAPDAPGGNPPPVAAVAPPPPPVQVPPPTMAVVPRSARPERADTLGKAGQIIIQQGFGFVQHTENRTTIALSPAIDFLVSDVFTIGIGLDVSRTTTSTTTATTIGGEAGSSSSSSTDVGAALSLGLLFPVSRVVALWPQIGGGVLHDFDGAGASTVITASEFALLLQPVRHFFLAIKPGVRGTRSLEGSDQSFHYSQILSTGIGGWW